MIPSCRTTVTILTPCTPQITVRNRRQRIRLFHLDGYLSYGQEQRARPETIRITITVGQWRCLRASVCATQTTDGVSRYHSHRQPGKALHAPTAHLPPTTSHPCTTPTTQHRRHYHSTGIYIRQTSCTYSMDHASNISQAHPPTTHPTHHAEAAQKPLRCLEHAYISYLCISAQKPQEGQIYPPQWVAL